LSAAESGVKAESERTARAKRVSFIKVQEQSNVDQRNALSAKSGVMKSLVE
jgi:hypothetical protein